MRTDAELMLAFQEGDEKAYEELVSQHYSAVLSYLCRLCMDHAQAEDVCQDTFFKLYHLRDKYKLVTTFKAFLYTVARNVFIDEYRKNKKHKTVSLETIYGENSLFKSPSANMKDASELAEESERMAKIMNAINELPATYRDVFLLSEIEQLKYAEISEILNIPVGTVKSRNFNAVKILQNTLKGVVDHAM